MKRREALGPTSLGPRASGEKPRTRRGCSSEARGGADRKALPKGVSQTPLRHRKSGLPDLRINDFDLAYRRD